MSLFSSRPTPDPVGPGQESVWDYPRPPRLEPVTAHLVVVLGGEVIADTTHGWRVLETSHPPNYYFPPDDVTPGAIARTQGSSFCEFKGRAEYFTVHGGDRIEVDAAWGYAESEPGVLGHHRPRRVLPPPDGRVHRRRRGRRGPGGRLLRRLDHERRGRPVQGWPGDPRLVTARGANPRRWHRRLDTLRAMPLDIAILIFDRLTALDAVGPYEVLSRIPTRSCGWWRRSRG